MNFKILFYFILFFFFMISMSLARFDEKEKQHFDVGRLIDFTPKEISSDSVTMNSDGPFLMVAGILRDPFIRDVRLPNEREKIRFLLEKGVGNLISAKEKSLKFEKEILAVPDNDGLVTVLFFPNKNCSDENFVITVSVVGNKKIVGTLKYEFQKLPIDSKMFNEVGRGNIKIERKMSKISRKEKVLISKNVYSEDGKKVKERKEETFLSYRREDGKVVIKRPNRKTGKEELIIKEIEAVDEKKYPYKRGIPWGISNENVIYLIEPTTTDPIEAIWAFFFYDKRKFVLSKTLYFSQSLIGLEERQYNYKQDVPSLSLQEENNSYLRGGKLSTRSIRHISQE